MKSKIKELEEKLAHATATSVQKDSPVSNPEYQVTQSFLTGEFHVHQESRTSGETQYISRSIRYKNRLFGQSHCCNGLIEVRLQFALSYFLV
jgi:hypothetical protein